MKTSLQIEDRQRFLKYNTESNIILKSEKLNFKSSPQKKIWLENKKSKKKRKEKVKQQAEGENTIYKWIKLLDIYTYSYIEEDHQKFNSQNRMLKISQITQKVQKRRNRETKSRGNKQKANNKTIKGINK